MSQIILIEENSTLNDLISININTYLGADIIIRKNASDTTALLSILPEIDLIITHNKIGLENTAEKIAEFIKDNNLTTPMIVLGPSRFIDNENMIHIYNERDWENVVHSAAKILGINENVFVKKYTPDYIATPAHYFLNLESVNCDVFIRIKKTPTEYQYIKRLHSNDSFNKETIKRYIAQGLNHFYISKDDHKNFTIFLSNKLVEKMDNPQIEMNQKIQIMGESYQIAIEEIIKIGFTSETIQLSESIIAGMLKNFEKSPEMSNLLHKVINSKTGILFQRCHLTSAVSFEILKNLKISDQNSYLKMAYASFFHDIVLADNEALSLINSFEELEKQKLNNNLWDLTFNHAYEAALLFRKYPETPEGVEEIIKNHHGSQNGKGFSLSVEPLSQLSKVFIVAHQFVIELLLFKEKGGVAKPIIEDLYKMYPQHDMIIIIKSLEKTLKKKSNAK